MKTQVKRNPWECHITAVSIVTETPVQKLQQIIGHDGSEILYPELGDPGGRRGYHPQELIVASRHLGWSVTPIQRIPVSQHSHLTRPLQDKREVIEMYVRETRGVLLGHGGSCGHAAAYEQGRVYEPDSGLSYYFSYPACEARNFFPLEIHIYDRLPQNV